MELRKIMFIFSGVVVTIRSPALEFAEHTAKFFRKWIVFGIASVNY